MQKAASFNEPRIWGILSRFTFDVSRFKIADSPLQGPGQNKRGRVLHSGMNVTVPLSIRMKLKP
jgi:hypothetical protein